MALTDSNSNGLIMPVAPMYGGGGSGFGGGFGNGDGWWIILLFLFALGGWGNGFGGGNGGGGMTPYIYSTTTNSDVQRGFDQAAVMSGINTLTSNVCNGFSDVQQSLCNGFASVNATVQNGFGQAEIANNARQIANMQQAFAAQTAMSQGFNNLGSQFADCCCENRLATADLRYTIATENCADRYEAAQNTRDIIENANRNNQAILDKLCALELDAKNDKIADLERQLTAANLSASQIAQTAQIQRGQVAEVDALYQRLKDCPVPSMPVYGSQPIFTCPNNNNGCGCGYNVA